MQLSSAYPVRNLNRKLEISTAPTKAKSKEPANSQVLVQNKIDRQRVRSRESGRQTVRRLWWIGFGVENRENGEGGREKRIGFVEEHAVARMFPVWSERSVKRCCKG